MSRRHGTPMDGRARVQLPARPAGLRLGGRWLLLAGATLVLRAAPLLSQDDSGTYFYRGLPYGSEAAFHPVAAVLHSGFYNFQLDNRGDDPFAIPFGRGLENVASNIANPVAALNRFGWGRFVTSEVLPSFDRDHAQWIPNYFGHILGEGLAFRMSMEWYRHHGFRRPALWGIATMLSGALINEVVENGAYDGVNVDPIADFYIFNPIGILLFSSDGAARFLRDRLGMAYWPLQAAFDPATGTLQNVGYRTAFRVRPPTWRVGLFALYGSQGLLGLTYAIDGEYALSWGGGVAADSLVDAEETPEGSRVLTATLGPAAGLFLDRRGSLLASVIVTPAKNDVVSLSLFPGVVGWRTLRPGMTVGWSRSEGMKVSLHLARLPLGIAIHSAGSAGTTPLR